MKFVITLSDKEIAQLGAMVDTKIEDDDTLVYAIRVLISELGGAE